MVKNNSPLDWPIGWKRTQNPRRSPFGEYSIDGAVKTLLSEIRRLQGIRNSNVIPECVISTNLKYRKDGLPYSDQRQPTDQGVAVYFTYEGKQQVIACDSFNRIQDNIYAIAKTIEAMRGIERWGASDLLQRAFTGFAALPMPAQRKWWEILECKEDSDPVIIKGQYRTLAQKYHPDKPVTGNQGKFQEIGFAYDQARKQLNFI